MQNTYDICATNMHVKCLTEFHINIVCYKLPTSNFTPHQSECPFVSERRFQDTAVCLEPFRHLRTPAPSKRLIRIGFGNCSKLHVWNVAVVIANYKIFGVNPQSSNEPVLYDWNKIIMNKMLSHHWRVFWRKTIFASQFGGNQMCCTRNTLQYLEQKLLHYW